MTPVQFTFDDLQRGMEHRRECRWLRRTRTAGTYIEDKGLTVLGHCELYGFTAYDQGCDTCTSWEERQ